MGHDISSNRLLLHLRIEHGTSVDLSHHLVGDNDCNSKLEEELAVVEKEEGTENVVPHQRGVVVVEGNEQGASGEQRVHLYH